MVSPQVCESDLLARRTRDCQTTTSVSGHELENALSVCFLHGPVNSHRAATQEWDGATKTNMRALREMVEEEMGVSMQSYLDAQENESNPEDLSDAH